MTLQQLHYAITIAENGSLNKAVEMLYIAQPSLVRPIEYGADIVVHPATKFIGGHRGQPFLPSTRFYSFRNWRHYLCG